MHEGWFAVGSGRRIGLSLGPKVVLVQTAGYPLHEREDEGGSEWVHHIVHEGWFAVGSG